MQQLKGQAAQAEVDDEEIKAGLCGTAQDQEDAFEKAYQRYAKPMAAHIREVAAPTLDSDEIATAVSKAFCGLADYIARGKFKSDKALSTLLFSMAEKKAYDQLRSKTCLKRRPADSKSRDGANVADHPESETEQEDFAAQVSQRLVKSPEIRKLWRTAADSCSANEIIRQFRLWIGTLPRLQRKVAQALLVHFGDVTNEEISDEISQDGEPKIPASSVKSARKEITRKFKTIIETLERTKRS